jgi:hypothetical protein
VRHRATRPNPFQDLLDDTVDGRHGTELTTNGPYIDLPTWGVHIFSITTLTNLGHRATAEGPVAQVGKGANLLR